MAKNRVSSRISSTYDIRDYKNSPSERGRKGGLNTRDKYGREYYQRIGKVGGKFPKKKPLEMTA